MSKFQTEIGDDAHNCFGSTAVSSGASATSVLSVLGSAQQKKLYGQYIVQYLRKSGRFSSVDLGIGLWP